jgi:ribulose-phosphate 3-epimerase
MVEIIPAILPKSFSDLEDHLSQLVGLVETVQIDICDGKLTPKASWPYLYPHDDDFEKIIHEEEGMPYWEEFEFEVHLMVRNPEKYVQDWISAGAKRITVQYESFANAEAALSFCEKFHEQFSGTGSLLAPELGVSINIDIPNIILNPLLPYIDYVQFMGIAHIGTPGNPFDDRVIDKIRTLRSAFHDLPISVDGGVNLDTAPQLIEAGADRLVSSSAIWESDDIAGTIEELENI